VALAAGVDAIVVMLGAGVASMLLRGAAKTDGTTRTPHAAFVGSLAAGGAAVAPVTLLGLFLTFLKIGAVVFGSGYVLLAFLRADLVDRLHWLTESELLDAVAVGQVTPGPVFTSATFIGFVVGARQGTAMASWGAVVATVGIFLPGFLLVAATRPLVARVRRSPLAGAFLDGVNAASVALMVVVGVQLARAAMVDVPTVIIALASAALLLRFKVSTTWLVAGGAALGVLAKAATVQ
jgi:chromate transporter